MCLPGVLGSAATLASILDLGSVEGTGRGHVFESDRVGFFVAHVISAFTGLVYFLLALLQAVLDFHHDEDAFKLSGHMAALLLLGSLSLHRVLLSISLHPFAQPLRAPIAAKTLLERQGSRHYIDPEARVEKGCFWESFWRCRRRLSSLHHVPALRGVERGKRLALSADPLDS